MGGREGVGAAEDAPIGVAGTCDAGRRRKPVRTTRPVQRKVDPVRLRRPQVAEHALHRLDAEGVRGDGAVDVLGGGVQRHPVARGEVDHRHRLLHAAVEMSEADTRAGPVVPAPEAVALAGRPRRRRLVADVADVVREHEVRAVGDARAAAGRARARRCGSRARPTESARGSRRRRWRRSRRRRCPLPAPRGGTARRAAPGGRCAAASRSASARQAEADDAGAERLGRGGEDAGRVAAVPAELDDQRRREVERGGEELAPLEQGQVVGAVDSGGETAQLRRGGRDLLTPFPVRQPRVERAAHPPLPARVRLGLVRAYQAIVLARPSRREWRRRPCQRRPRPRRVEHLHRRPSGLSVFQTILPR